MSTSHLIRRPPVVRQQRRLSPLLYTHKYTIYITYTCTTYIYTYIFVYIQICIFIYLSFSHLIRRPPVVR